MGEASPAPLSVPVIDISPFTNGVDPEKRKEAARALTDVCQSHGFVQITGHGVPAALVQEAFGWSKKLFDLPHEEKMKAPHPAGPVPHRGYSDPGLEKVMHQRDLPGVDEHENDFRKVQDFKESYEIGSEANPVQQNIWLPEDVLPGFRDFMVRFYWELHRTARVFLEAVSLGLGLTAEEKALLLKTHSGENNQLRLLHYPPVSAEMIKTQVLARMPAHQDWSSFTFLFQDDVGGLEFEDPNQRDRFARAEPVPGALALNIDLFPSATHRVTLPPLDHASTGNMSAGVTRARYSIPYFVGPNNHDTVECLPSCVTPERPAQFEPVAWADYNANIARYQYKRERKA